ncbi:winged helix-turn-helix transcriptional regulator [Savagea sp. SN6]|uniref:Winged helix-turn-helix transcriptional regulator n=1 Tax=Savagea serpentis TaxID=2785297 RepID=A0A8J7KDY9_9BACL|nr:metalloregulator ArsR/SmtB family transcription factor [Savagea serpentis]MBF4500621.1 winged helix-turn-helix transcriptional regulator [Savagea serpentis]
MTFLETEHVLKALGEETRLRIVSYLVHDAFCICELVALLDMSQPSISQHMKRLKEASIVTEERRGKWVYYSLRHTHPLYPLILHIIQTLPSIANTLEPLTAEKRRLLCE